MQSMLLIAAAVLLAAAAGLAAPTGTVLQRQGDAVEVRHGGRALPISLQCPRFAFEGAAGGAAVAPAGVQGEVAAGSLEVSYAPLPLGDAGALEATLHLKWSPEEGILRKWARYRVTGASAAPLLREVVLEDLDAAAAQFTAIDWQSRPAFLPGFFAGIEYPVATTRVEGGRLLVAHRPGRRLQPGTWYETRKAVFGVAPAGQERAAFQAYIAAHRPGGTGLHVNYNSWWTSPVPYTEADILKLMQAFEQKLYRPHGVPFDTFCIDMGWSNVKSVWEIDPKLFPQGFTRIQEAAARMGARLGLWISPSSCYPGALDNDWAGGEGYEIIAPPGGTFRYACLGGQRYETRFRDRLVDMVTRYKIGHIKFDGYLYECAQTGHGHEPGALSHEALVDGIVDVFQSVRRISPDTWLEPTCFGWDPSPWWLFYVDSVIGTFGDDAPPGRVPAPVYRQSYTTGRDFFNLQGTHHLPIPPLAQEVLGIIHQTGEPFMDDAVMTVLRGHRFLPVYLNPGCMDAPRWKALAELLKWARKRAPLWQETWALLPESWAGDKCPRNRHDVPMPREPYGYAHRAGDGMLVVLRNPWVTPQSYPLELKGGPGDQGLTAVSLYPEVRAYGEGLHWGQTLSVPVLPYETLVLQIAPSVSGVSAPPTPPNLGGLGEAGAGLSSPIQAAVSQRQVGRVEFEGPKEAFGPDWTSLVGGLTAAARVALEASVTVAAPRAELLILLEGKTPPVTPLCRLRVNGKEAALAPTGSETGWSATGLSKPEHWLFLRAPLARGRSQVSLEILADTAETRVSAWVWATKPGRAGRKAHQDALPPPEALSLGTFALVEPTEMAGITGPVTRLPRPVERIEGLFLDSLEPAKVEQGGYGTLQRNQSVWEKPMTINGRRFVRGLGTHAPSRIVYALDGKYRRFQCWAGADAATGPMVTFEVKVDGKKRWESGLMQRHDAAKRVDLDVRGAKTLELLVGDGGNGVAADHADWADARLLR